MLNFKGRFFVIGREEDLKDFTCEIAWYMSGVGQITSVNHRSDGRICLNIVNAIPEREDYFIAEMTKLANKYGLTGFQDWNEWKGE